MKKYDHTMCSGDIPSELVVFPFVCGMLFSGIVETIKVARKQLWTIDVLCSKLEFETVFFPAAVGGWRWHNCWTPHDDWWQIPIARCGRSRKSFAADPRAICNTLCLKCFENRWVKHCWRYSRVKAVHLRLSSPKVKQDAIEYWNDSIWTICERHGSV